jgi:hypothetical protein
MATGDITLYDKWLEAQEDAGLSSTPVDFDTDTISVAVMNDTFSPDTGHTSAQVYWSDISANQVATGTAYTGPVALAAKTLTVSSGVVTFDADNIVIAQDATGFTNGRRIAVFKNTGTPTTSPLIGVGDLGANKSIQTGSLTLAWNANGLIRWTKA